VPALQVFPASADIAAFVSQADILAHPFVSIGNSLLSIAFWHLFSFSVQTAESISDVLSQLSALNVSGV
jgi:hypothetical protein